MVKDKSNKMHQDFFHTVSGLTADELANIPDHYQFSPDQLPYWDQFDTVKLQGGAGSLFLWDSRTTHSVSAFNPITPTPLCLCPMPLTPVPLTPNPCAPNPCAPNPCAPNPCAPNPQPLCP